MATGRKKDPVWNDFVEIQKPDGNKCVRVQCKECSLEIVGLVARLKKHKESCNPPPQVEEIEETCSDEDVPNSNNQAQSSTSTPSTSSTSKSLKRISSESKENVPKKQSTLSAFMVKTSSSLKSSLDEQIAKFIYATNSSFRIADHQEFKKAVQLLRPGYTPPSAFDIGGKLLDKIYSDSRSNCANMLKDQTLCLSMDGWSNVHNDPIICVTGNLVDTGEIILIGSIDTSGNPHTAEYLTNVAAKEIKKCEADFHCKVKSFVTDNAANMSKMRKQLQNDHQLNLITYGCSAHLLNLLAHDIEIHNVKKHVVQVVKYFRNNHFAHAMYKTHASNVLIIPQDVRWNSFCDCLESYLKHWPILLGICDEHRNKIDKTVSEKVADINLKRNAEEMLSYLKPISIALDRVQNNKCSISDSVHIWKELGEKLAGLKVSEVVMKKFKERYNQALAAEHFLAYELNPKYVSERKYELSPMEKEKALELAQEKGGLLALLINFQAKVYPFSERRFDKSLCQTVSPMAWWKSIRNDVGSEPDFEAILQLLTASASSAGVERVFSSYGLVHSKLRNRLGNDKAAKLVFLFKYFNSAEK